MSDREIRTGLRALTQSGQVVEQLSEYIQGLPQKDVYALMRFTRFWKERTEKRYFLSGEYVAVMYLSDDHLAELLQERKTIGRLSIASDDTHKPYSDYAWQQFYKNNHRTEIDLAIEEANFRGIFAPPQLDEMMALAGDNKAKLKKLKKMVRGSGCLERSHNWEYWAKDRCYVCLNCRRKVTDEEIYTGILAG